MGIGKLGRPWTWEEKCAYWGVDPNKSVEQIQKELAEREKKKRREWYINGCGCREVWLEGDKVCVHKDKVKKVIGMADVFPFDETNKAFLMDRARYHHMTTVLKDFPSLKELEEWDKILHSTG